MRPTTLTTLLLVAGTRAHPAGSPCKSWDVTTTTTFTNYQTEHVVDKLGVQLFASPFLDTKIVVIPTSNCDKTLPARDDSGNEFAQLFERQKQPVTTTTKRPVTSTTTTTTTNAAVVTNKAYIDTVMRQHNRHRANHTVSALTWSSSLGETAKKIAQTCVYQHNSTIDCPNGGCYGQNIGAGYGPTQMALLISNGFYNSEVNNYKYYGGEPDLNTFGYWGHFSQIVWKSTTSVACYTADCSATGLQFPGGGGQGIPPYFTVCNYGPPGNFVGGNYFTTNVLRPQGYPSIYAGYNCPTAANCEG